MSWERELQVLRKLEGYFLNEMKRNEEAINQWSVSRFNAIENRHEAKDGSHSRAIASQETDNLLAAARRISERTIELENFMRNPYSKIVTLESNKVGEIIYRISGTGIYPDESIFHGMAPALRAIVSSETGDTLYKDSRGPVQVWLSLDDVYNKYKNEELRTLEHATVVDVTEVKVSGSFIDNQRGCKLELLGMK